MSKEWEETGKGRKKRRNEERREERYRVKCVRKWERRDNKRRVK